VMIGGYVMGLPYGPKGVAFAYSAAMTLWVVPHIAWGVHGTAVSLRDIVRVASRPLVSGIVAAALAFGVQFFFGQSMSHLPRLMLGATILIGTYVGMLFYVMGQKALYVDLIRGMKKRSSIDESAMASV